MRCADDNTRIGMQCTREIGDPWRGHRTQQKNIERVGMPAWSDADQKLAKALQKEISAKEEGLRSKPTPLEPPKEITIGGGSDNVGDISWNVPMVYLRYPANIPNLPGHNWTGGRAGPRPCRPGPAG